MLLPDRTIKYIEATVSIIGSGFKESGKKIQCK
jgi:hypothetical protein